MAGKIAGDLQEVCTKKGKKAIVSLIMKMKGEIEQ